MVKAVKYRDLAKALTAVGCTANRARVIMKNGAAPAVGT